VIVPLELCETLAAARSVLILTGAGVSAESGIPTFRDALTGLWARYDPSQLATAEAFARDPALVARWYDERRAHCAAAHPNAGHRALAEMERAVTARGGGFLLATQNVDRLHHEAGSRNVVELHGTLWLWRCVDCGHEREERGPPFTEYPPRCECGGARRPGVVWFGEVLPERALAAAHQAAAGCDVFLALGTSALVYPAAGLIDAARASGATTVEINREATPASGSVDFALRGPSGELLPDLVGQAFGGGR